MSKNDGGLAFPGSRYEDVQYAGGEMKNVPVAHGGMTLRDYFAAAALQGMLANGFMPNMVPEEYMPARGFAGFKWDYVKASFWLADAMLKARDHQAPSSSPTQSQSGEAA